MGILKVQLNCQLPFAYYIPKNAPAPMYYLSSVVIHFDLLGLVHISVIKNGATILVIELE